jgi:hypothetical protein
MTTLHGPASWLFVKGQDTIWILRSEGGHLVVCGPGNTREDFAFDGEVSMETFHVSYAERLISSGWILWGIDRERRTGRDRRSTHREHTDRRGPAADGSVN